MRSFGYVILMFVISFSLACSAGTETPEPPTPAPEPEGPQAIDLFNGNSLEGWRAFLVDPEVKKEEVWSVQDGVLVCKGEPLGYLYTETEHESFDLVVEWRWAPGTEPGNSGVLLRVNGEPMAIPRSIEAQLMNGNAGDLYGFHGMQISGAEDRMRGGEDHELLGDFVGVGKIEANENPPGEWNKYEISLNGSDLSVSVNGKNINSAENCDVLAGPIGLQSEGGEIHFRTVRLTPIE